MTKSLKCVEHLRAFEQAITAIIPEIISMILEYERIQTKVRFGLIRMSGGRILQCSMIASLLLYPADQCRIGEPSQKLRETWNPADATSVTLSNTYVREGASNFETWIRELDEHVTPTLSLNPLIDWHNYQDPLTC